MCSHCSLSCCQAISAPRLPNTWPKPCASRPSDHPGILGSQWLLFALSGMAMEDAYHLLLREDYPSWLLPDKTGRDHDLGALGWSEADGSFAPIMDSFNHYALGSVGEWMYRVVDGINIDPASPGCTH